jgi:hypothetical protein
MISKLYKLIFLFIVMELFSLSAFPQKAKTRKIIAAGEGWAGNSINTVVFRRNSLCTYNDKQYISYYDNKGFVVLGKRKLNSDKWDLQTTIFKGNISDAHNTISIMADGDGFLHLAWDHHNNPLNYCKSILPGSLEMSEKISMTGKAEQHVTYPEFYKMPDGDLIFLYRDGQSGRGNLVINCYDIQTKQWKQLHSNLIDGENQRNAYWQACIDNKGTIHLSWVWRESPDVTSNHDMCYARSADGGLTWENSKGEKYQLPINSATAEYVCRIPQNSELINQTSIYANEDGIPFIASYWKDKGDPVPQYHILYRKNDQWQVQDLGFRKMAFSLNGVGTKRIPISRPQIISWKKNGNDAVALVFRDEELGNRVSVAINNNIQYNNWELTNLTTESVGSWEPTYDTELWKKKKQLNLFVQFTEQNDGEGKADIAPQQVKVMSVKIK